MLRKNKRKLFLTWRMEIKHWGKSVKVSLNGEECQEWIFPFHHHSTFTMSFVIHVWKCIYTEMRLPVDKILKSPRV